MKTSIATVSIAGSLREKLVAIARAGFDGYEIFEPDLVASDMSPEEIRSLSDDLGLSIDLYQPFRDFEGVSTEQLSINERRAGAKFAPEAHHARLLECQDRDRRRSATASQLRRMAELAQSLECVLLTRRSRGAVCLDLRPRLSIVRSADHDALGVCSTAFTSSPADRPRRDRGHPNREDLLLPTSRRSVSLLDVLSWSRHHRLFPGEGDRI